MYFRDKGEHNLYYYLFNVIVNFQNDELFVQKISGTVFFFIAKMTQFLLVIKKQKYN